MTVNDIRKTLIEASESVSESLSAIETSLVEGIQDASNRLDEFSLRLDELEARVRKLEGAPPAPPPDPPAGWGPLSVYPVAGLNLRREPTIANNIVGSMPVGTKVSCLNCVEEASVTRSLGRSLYPVFDPRKAFSMSPTERQSKRIWAEVSYQGKTAWCAAWLMEEASTGGGLPFASPVGTEEERASGQIWPGTWQDVNPFGTRYKLGAGFSIHTGADLNNNSPTWDSDNGAPVYAAADGVVSYAEDRPDSWGRLVVIRHADKEHSRYGHLREIVVRAGQRVSRGQLIGYVGGSGFGRDDYHPAHLHFDISTSGVLEERPWDWPGDDPVRTRQHYVDPAAFIRDRLGAAQPAPATTSRSKLGPHIDRPLPQQWALLPESRCRFAVVNLPAEGVQLVRHLLDTNKGMVIVTRDTSLEVRPGQDFDQQARQWMAAMEPYFEALSGYDLSNVYFTAQNEQGYSPEACQFELVRMRLLEARGLKAGLFNFSLGTPDLEDWNRPPMVQALEQARAGGHVLCLHEYVGRDLHEMREGGEGWIFLRYRKVRRRIHPDIKMAITEAGMDHIAQVKGSARGWKKTTDASTYLNLLKGMDAEWMKDEYVLGGAVFLHGAWNMDDWSDYDISPFENEFYGYISRMAT